MVKSLLTGMAVFAAMAVFVGNADAYKHKTHVHKTWTAQTVSPLAHKGGPLHDCVHVTFPQCGRGPDEPND